MSSVATVDNQTIYDVCLMAYGTVEALAEVLALNPELKNDGRAKVAVGIDPIGDTSFYLDLPLERGTVVVVNTDSPMINGNVIKELLQPVITFNL